ncbi:hypothetical protein Aspvir_000025 [Aspergillus viridinutans]|uniref:Uncharacterized protein n=1 Tax=Aspergillus viridinutans TaxID=75553 RepID=A0A9P3BK44_ASPVI|nr:uncharacterized protein Aspvir_000025 [Aspergillus viridinutans]GIJ97919.1 hypothetical protein Aspvir_000025 [Aspergillus viridinutans]
MLRSQQLTGVLKSAVLHELDRRGVSSTRRLYDIQIFPGSALVDDAFREALKYENLPCLDDIVETLSSSQDGSWRQFYSLLPDRDKPQSIKDLVNADTIGRHGFRGQSQATTSYFHPQMMWEQAKSNAPSIGHQR